MLRDVETLIGPDLAETLRNLPEEGGIDAALIKLAKRYAHELDEAARVATWLDEIDAEQLDDYGRLIRLEQRVTTVMALSNLGPKLMATLVELRATPKARAVKGGDGASQGSQGGKLGKLRDARNDNAA